MVANKILQFFKYKHLSEGKMQDTSMMFSVLADTLEAQLPKNPESTVAFRKLLEAKDAAVRSLIYKEPVDGQS